MKDGRNRAVENLVYEAVQELLAMLFRLHPQPAPDLLLNFLASYRDRIRVSYTRKFLVAHPLVALLEIYSRLFTKDRKKLDPSAKAPPPEDMEKLERLRVDHLAAVRAIHTAMKEFEWDCSKVRTYTSLMEAYDRGRAYEEVWRIWDAMRAEGGVGIDQRAVSVVSFPFPSSYLDQQS